MDKKIILGIDFFILAGTLALIVFSVGYVQPLLIAPQDGYESNNGAVLFSFEKADVILIDDNIDFSSPDEYHVEDNLVINLKPGVYYWKAVGVLPSEIREFKINSEISLKLKQDGEGYEVVNAGNERLNVDVYSEGKIIGNVVLDVDGSEGVFGDKFVGRSDE
ncbi:hypothetical protein COY00_03660 [Candidatus Pacearchaeota archaeon CG_4_10_14_0_2_um_filter_35_33]|nr:hypothetical protein [Candidatus Pacearchaeota archaeon]PIZ79668.1 MAG: hypothetical protein COY00_03660 [Candidatus Pacearchaeota archaeon CG_4_10_14_0_2_um_filter_35_33]PJA70018.1 MAG: hypothetical protein CO155_02215 [Candidatus Pacearchaeota archaeon CG_4_9_14_3_um_filter_35_19]